jgi:hypothetical protein
VASESYRGIVRQGTVLVLDEMPLAEGTEVLITPIAGETNNSAAVLAAVNGPPHVPAAWVDELEQLIAEGQRPPTRDDPFAETQD